MNKPPVPKLVTQPFTNTVDFVVFIRIEADSNENSCLSNKLNASLSRRASVIVVKLTCEVI